MTKPTPGHYPRPALGTTLTLRVRTPVGPISVVGELVAADDERWSIRRRDRSVTVVDVAAIEAGREVPAPRSRLASVSEVEQVAALGWRALETTRLGDWLLRAAGGFTGRANLALAVGDPGRSVDAALDSVEEWYAERGLPAQVQVPDGAAPTGLADAAAARGWRVSPGVHVMTAEIAHALRAAPDFRSVGLELRVDEAPDEAWVACYRRTSGPLQGVAQQVLTNHPAALFASIRDADHVVAIARAAVDAKWAGLFAVEVDPDQRRRGLGTGVSVAAVREAARRGARRAYLQVTQTNTAGIALYDRLNFAVHHDYAYWAAGDPQFS